MGVEFFEAFGGILVNSVQISKASQAISTGGEEIIA